MRKIFILILLFWNASLVFSQTCSQSPVEATATNTLLSSGQSSTLNYTGCIGGKVAWTSGAANTLVSNTNVTPSTTTTYKATCTFSATNTCNSSVTVNVLPACAITATISKAAINEGENSTLAHTGCVGGSISWKDADGNSISNPTVSPNKSTTYSVMCAYDNGQSCVASVAITVTPSCTIDAFVSEPTITIGESSTLSNTGCVGGVVSWAIGTVAVPNLTVSPTTNTSYTAKCTYANGSTCNDIVSITVLPVCTITAAASTVAIKAGANTTLSHTGCVGGQVSWRNAQNNVLNNLIINPTETSTFKVSCAYASGNICNSEITIAVVPATCSITASASQNTIQSGQTSLLSSTGCEKGIVSWKQNTTILTSLAVKPTTTTSYTAICTFSDNSTCTSSATVTVSPTTTCGLTAIASNFAVMAGSSQTSTTLSALSTTGCTGLVTWKTGSTTITNLTVSPTTTTTYTASCASSPTTTCTSSVTIVYYPACSITANVVDNAISVGQKTSLTYSGCANGQVKWQDATNLELTSLLVAPTAAATYKATCSFPGITATNGTCTSSIAVNVFPTCNIVAKATKLTVVSGTSTTLSATGCTGGTISWFSGSNQITALNVSPTTNTTYKALCTYGANLSTCEGTVTIKVMPICTITATATKTVVSAGETITLSHTGCSGGTFYWKNAAGSLIKDLTFKPSQTQVYTATCNYDGQNSCVSTVSITVNYAIALGTITSNKPSCGGGNNASIKVPLNRAFTGVEESIKLSLTLGTTAIGTFYTIHDNFAEIKNLKAGIYTVKVETLDGSTVKATATGTHTIIDGGLVNFTSLATDVKCFGGADGELKITATGGTSPYYYDFGNLNTFNQFDAATILTLKKQKKLTTTAIIKDAKGCVSEAKPIEIKQPLSALLAVLKDQKNPLGFETKDGQATIEVTGGTPNYTFAWTDEKNISYGAGVTTNAAAASTNKNSTLRGGTYTVKIFDKNYATSRDSAGCTATKTVKLVEPPQLKIGFTVEKPASCADRADGKFSVVLSGGVPFETGLPYKFTVKHKTIAYEGFDKLTYEYVPGGIYVMKITDQNNISRTLEFTLPSPTAIIPKVVKQKNLVCFEDKSGSFELEISGGLAPYTAIWNNNLSGLKLSNLSAGKYIGLVTDSFQCEVLVLAEINQPPKLDIKFDATPAICADACIAQLSASITGGVLPYTYNWDNGNNTTLSFTKLCHNTNQTLTVKDKNECVFSKTNTFALINSLVIPISAVKTVCNQSDIWLNATTENAVSYFWESQSGELFKEANLITNKIGVYNLTVKDSSNCEFYKKVTLKQSEFTAPKVLFTAPSEVGLKQNFVMVNLLNPMPSSVEWLLPNHAKLGVVSEFVANLSMAKAGEYKLGMQANYNDCQSFKSTKLIVLENLVETISTNSNEQNILLKVGANPNNGQFKLNFFLEKESAFSIQIWDGNQNAIPLFEKNASGINEQEINIDLGKLNPTTLFLKMKVGKQIITKKIIIVN